MRIVLAILAALVVACGNIEEPQDELASPAVSDLKTLHRAALTYKVANEGEWPRNIISLKRVVEGTLQSPITEYSYFSPGPDSGPKDILFRLNRLIPVSRDEYSDYEVMGYLFIDIEGHVSEGMLSIEEVRN